MGLVPLTVEVFLVFVLTFYLINKYARLQNQNAIVAISTFIGWFFSFVIIFVLPLDVAITFYHKCESRRASNGSLCELPGGFVTDDVLLNLWEVTYWTAQVLTWIVLPLLQCYVTAGDFTVWGKLKAALFNNALYYGLYLFCFVVMMVYAVIKGVVLNVEHMKVIIISASNTWGLFLLVLLLGYGLVEVPRSLWHTGRQRYRLNKTYFDIEKLASDKSEAEENVKEIYRKSRAVINLLKNDHSARAKAQVILAKFPENVVDRLFPARSAMEFNAHSDTNSAQVASEAFLTNLHRKVIVSIQSHHATCAQWSELINRAIFLENIAQAENLGTRLQLPEKSILPQWAAQLWYVKLRRPVCKLLGVLFSVMTVFILVSECTFFVVSPTLSPAALLMDYAAKQFHYKYTQFVAMAIIFYLCACAYFTIFRLKIYKYYHLDPRGNTDENSMLFSAILLCRLTPPICLNFLGMIHMDSHISMIKDVGIETQFTKLMGHLDVIPIIAKGINIYLPFCILVFCAVHYFRIATYLLHSLGFDQFVEEDEMTREMVNAGKSLVQIEKNSMRRKAEGVVRQERYRKHAKKIQGYKMSNLAEDERPMIGDDDDDDVEEGNRILPRQQTTPQRGNHPSPANFFDDM